MMRAKVDKELTRQLEAAASNAEVGASFSLDPGPSRVVIPPDETEETVKKLLKKVEQEVGVAPTHSRVHKYLGSFSVTAAPSFIRKLCEHDEVTTATASRRPEKMLIEPVSSEPVPEPTPERPRSSRGKKGQ